MPLRKSPVRTPAHLAANRANSLKSIGPRLWTIGYLGVKAGKGRDLARISRSRPTLFAIHCGIQRDGRKETS